jgi:hypothetical protein
MAERVPHDHPSVSTVRAEFARSGGTRRPCLRLPADLVLDDGDLIRLVLDGTQYHARVVTDSTGPLLRGADDNRRLARESGDGTNRLLAWAEDHDCGPGDAVDLDEVEAGTLYGLRDPGATAVYRATRGPDQSLTDIARDLDG